MKLLIGVVWGVQYAYARDMNFAVDVLSNANEDPWTSIGSGDVTKINAQLHHSRCWDATNINSFVMNHKSHGLDPTSDYLPTLEPKILSVADRDDQDYANSGLVSSFYAGFAPGDQYTQSEGQYAGPVARFSIETQFPDISYAGMGVEGNHIASKTLTQCKGYHFEMDYDGGHAGRFHGADFDNLIPTTARMRPDMVPGMDYNARIDSKDCANYWTAEFDLENWLNKKTYTLAEVSGFTEPSYDVDNLVNPLIAQGLPLNNSDYEFVAGYFECEVVAQEHPTHVYSTHAFISVFGMEVEFDFEGRKVITEDGGFTVSVQDVPAGTDDSRVELMPLIDNTNNQVAQTSLGMQQAFAGEGVGDDDYVRIVLNMDPGNNAFFKYGHCHAATSLELDYTVLDQNPDGPFDPSDTDPDFIGVSHVYYNDTDMVNPGAAENIERSLDLFSEIKYPFSHTDTRDDQFFDLKMPKQMREDIESMRYYSNGAYDTIGGTGITITFTCKYQTAWASSDSSATAPTAANGGTSVNGFASEEEEEGDGRRRDDEDVDGQFMRVATDFVVDLGDSTGNAHSVAPMAGVILVALTALFA